jgi:hypothetical protein
LENKETSYGGYQTEFAPETSRITGLKINSKSLNLKIKSVYRLKRKNLRGLVP